MIEAYLIAFVNYKQNDRVYLLPIVELAYNNAKNVRTCYIPFELNYNHYPRIFYKEDNYPCSDRKSVEKLSTELHELMIISSKNLYYA